jgi:hypothetical protein
VERRNIQRQLGKNDAGTWIFKLIIHWQMGGEQGRLTFQLLVLAKDILTERRNRITQKAELATFNWN